MTPRPTQHRLQQRPTGKSPPHTQPAERQAQGEFCAIPRTTSRTMSVVFQTFLVALLTTSLLPLASGQDSGQEEENNFDNLEPVVKQRTKESQTASLIGLNKRSGQAQKLRAPVGRSLRFETLTIRLLACTRILYPRFEDAAALLSISEREEGVLFKGWMYAQDPSLSAMDHPIYDVWIERCLP